MSRKQRNALQEGAVAHPVLGALVLGIGWGLIAGSASAVRSGNWRNLAVYSVIGVLAFGPCFVYLSRREARRSR